jgi:hypothetical protein
VGIRFCGLGRTFDHVIVMFWAMRVSAFTLSVSGSTVMGSIFLCGSFIRRVTSGYESNEFACQVSD